MTTMIARGSAMPFRVVALSAAVGLAALAVAGCGGSNQDLAVSLPVNPCKTTVHLRPGKVPFIVHPHYLPRRAPAPDHLDTGDGARLAWYEGHLRRQPQMKILAPRGWTCSAVIDPGGRWEMDLYAARGKYDQNISLSGSYGLHGADIPCFYQRQGLKNLVSRQRCLATATTTFTRKGPHLVLVHEPLPAPEVSVEGMVTFFPRRGNSSDTASCALAGKLRPLCAAILDETRQRLLHTPSSRSLLPR